MRKSLRPMPPEFSGSSGGVAVQVCLALCGQVHLQVRRLVSSWLRHIATPRLTASGFAFFSSLSHVCPTPVFGTLAATYPQLGQCTDMMFCFDVMLAECSLCETPSLLCGIAYPACVSKAVIGDDNRGNAGGIHSFQVTQNPLFGTEPRPLFSASSLVNFRQYTG